MTREQHEVDKHAWISGLKGKNLLLKCAARRTSLGASGAFVAITLAKFFGPCRIHIPVLFCVPIELCNMSKQRNFRTRVWFSVSVKCQWVCNPSTDS